MERFSVNKSSQHAQPLAALINAFSYPVVAHFYSMIQQSLHPASSCCAAPSRCPSLTMTGKC